MFIRDKIVAAGGLPPLLEILATGTPLQAEKAAMVLENLAMERANADAMVDAGVESALLSRLDVVVQQGTHSLAHEPQFELLDCGVHICFFKKFNPILIYGTVDPSVSGVLAG